jgi:hypothetical protein
MSRECLGFNATVRRMMNQEGYTYEGAVRECARRALVVRRARALRKSYGELRLSARNKAFDGVESPKHNE